MSARERKAALEQQREMSTDSDADPVEGCPTPMDAKTTERGKAMIAKLCEVNQSGCHIWKGCKLAGGYGHMTLSGKTKGAHRWSYMVHMRIAELDQEVQIRHMCGVALCVNPEHLTTGNVKDQFQDKIRDGTSNHGKQAKITLETARKIKFSKGEGTAVARAVRFGTTEAIVGKIDRSYTWAWVGRTPEEDNKLIPSAKKQEKKRQRPTSLTEEWCKEALERLESGSSKQKECWLWNGMVSKDGYGTIKFHQLCFKVHILACMAANPSIEFTKETKVRHMCSQTRCCNPSHVEPGTSKQNAADRIRDGTDKRGEKNWCAKITTDIAREIKRSRGEGTQKARAERFAVPRSIVVDIDCGKNWKHV